MSQEDELSGLDYVCRPLLELQSHPKFDEDAYRKMLLISEMKTEDIRRIDLIGGIDNA